MLNASDKYFSSNNICTASLWISLSLFLSLHLSLSCLSTFLRDSAQHNRGIITTTTIQQNRFSDLTFLISHSDFPLLFELSFRFCFTFPIPIGQSVIQAVVARACCSLLLLFLYLRIYQVDIRIPSSRITVTKFLDTFIELQRGRESPLCLECGFSL